MVFGGEHPFHYILIAILSLSLSLSIIDTSLFSSTKEAMDDLGRYRADKLTNEVLCSVAIDGVRTQIRSKDIRVGHLVYVFEDDQVPCDLVVLKSSDEHGLLHVQTSNLDGETNLKSRHATVHTMHMDEDDIIGMKAIIECAPPNSEIYRFDSRMKILSTKDPIDEVQVLLDDNDLDDSKEYLPLDSNNMILQATTLRNVDWILGVAVYTGNETKIGMNKYPAPSKWAHVDRIVNRTSMGIFVFQIILSITWGLLGVFLNKEIASHHYYLMYPVRRPKFSFTIPFRFLLLMSMMIPISLRVSMEIAKYICTRFIEYDADMFHNDTSTTCNDSAIAEDLGQIEYLLTDKTGTLTENMMKFSQCAIQGISYGSNKHPANTDKTLKQKILTEDKHALQFFKLLALCHTAVPVQGKKSPKEDDDSPTSTWNTFHKGSNMRKTKSFESLSLGEEEFLLNQRDSTGDESIRYKSSSPDEEALVLASQQLGIELFERSRDILKIRCLDRIETYQVLHTLEFNSDRKRMSVLIRNTETNKITLYSKGSDDMMIPRTHFKDNELEGCMLALQSFSSSGLRTLCLGMKDVTEDQYLSWKDEIHVASLSLDNKDELLSKVYDHIETEFEYVGITAIEDKLQENVPDTIHALQEAGIHVWMLTGDKHETAIQIGKSCRLITDDGYTFSVIGSNIEEIHELLEDALLRCSDVPEDQPIHTVINGNAWTWIQTPELKPLFIELAFKSKSIICCRVTPQQKAQIVELVKQQKKIVLAIGDGGNDVPMIQMANVGVGIIGKEGHQAAKAADFSIGRFRFLAKLLFVHGRWAYRRTAFISQYCFHKSMFIALFQLFFAFYNGFSGASLFDGIALASYNLFFTGLPVMLYTMDQDLDKETLLRYPHLYKETQSGSQMNIKTISYWILRTVIQAAFVFWTILSWWTNTNRGDGLSHAVLSQSVYGACIILQTMSILLEYKYVLK